MLFLTEQTGAVERTPREPLALDEHAIFRNYSVRRLQRPIYSLEPKFGLDGFEITMALTAPLALALPLIGLFSLFG